MLALDIRGLKKSYSGHPDALCGIDLTVNTGDFFALLGPNGAGKSTIIGILTSIVQKTSGTVVVSGHNIDNDFSSAKACIGVVPQEFNFSIFETVSRILLDQAGYYGISASVASLRVDKLLKQLDLWGKRHATIRSLSGGMKRRVMIARALVHEPSILILDEPTAGVDIELRRQMWRFLKSLNEKGTTIILTTHYLEEAESLCNQIAIINNGKIIVQSPMAALLQKLDVETFILYLQEPTLSTPRIPGSNIQQIDATTLEAEVTKSYGVTQLLAALSKEGIIVNSLRNKENRLEALFLRLTQE